MFIITVVKYIFGLTIPIIMGGVGRRVAVTHCMPFLISLHAIYLYLDTTIHCNPINFNASTIESSYKFQ